MRVSGLSAAGDWRFGKGRAVYLRRSDAIAQNVITRLKSFTDDWFLDIDEGMSWLELLGSKDNEKRILREVETRVLQTYGVRSISLLRVTNIDINRAASIELTYTDIFDEQINQTVSVP